MRSAVSYDTELRRHHAVLSAAADVQPSEHVLDIGCGTGQTTREAAGLARDGSALGVDVSAEAIDSARGQAAAAGLANIAFEQGDAQVHPFAPESFDLAVSRFGTMFFGDPVAAFGNVARALRPAGRLVMIVWQARERNEWAVAIRQALEAVGAPAAGPVTKPNAFSLADPSSVRRTLHAAGFAEVALAEVHEPVYYGPDVPAALEWVRSFTKTSDEQRRHDPTLASRLDERLCSVLAAHETHDGVWLDSRAWLVTARRAADGLPSGPGGASSRE